MELHSKSCPLKLRVYFVHDPYQNFSGKWVSPQDLTTNKVVNIQAATDYSGGLIEQDSDMDQEVWQKVETLILEPTEGDTEAKILVYYGQWLVPVVPGEFSVEKLSLDNYGNDDIVDFQQLIGHLGNQMNFVGAQEGTRVLPFLQMTLTAEGPQTDTLDYVYFEQAEPATAPIFYPSVDLFQRKLTLRASFLPFYGFLFGGIVDGDEKKPVLFSQISDQQAQVIPIRNQPGKFIFINEGEAFLVSNPDFGHVSRNLTFSPKRQFSESAFQGLPLLDPVIIFAALQFMKLLSSEGKVDRKRVAATSLTLLQQDISIFLQGEKKSVPFTDTQARYVKNLLLSQSTAISYTPSFTAPAKNVSELNFSVTRLTTGAVVSLSASLFAGGIDALLTPESQNKPRIPQMDFQALHPSSQIVHSPPINFGNQVSFSGPYGRYYWELFFHVPMLVAYKLNTQQLFRKSQKWLQYVFNPTQGNPADTATFWNFLPFKHHTLQTLKQQLTSPAEVHAYDDDPFDPFAIANLRIGAYEKAVVMKYIDNLINWGDQEFTRYTWESIVAATNLYTYAYDLLGKKPVDEGSCEAETPATFADIQQTYQHAPKGIPQFLIDLENSLATTKTHSANIGTGQVPFNELHAYFCVPENAQFVTYWGLVQDRLYKIRHCLNIEGQKEPLPLFQPPINPMALVRAAADGGNVIAVASSLTPAILPYRFPQVLAAARQFTQTLTSLGQALLQALEKKDVQALAQLRATHEVNLLNLSTQVFAQHETAIEAKIAALTAQQSKASSKVKHYNDLINNGWLKQEHTQVADRQVSAAFAGIASIGRVASILPYLFPNIFGFSDGGSRFGGAVNAGAQASQDIALAARYQSDASGYTAQYDRRAATWTYEKQLAKYEVTQLGQEIAAAEARLAMVQAESTRHQTAITQSQAEETFLTSKFTNEALYEWMVGQVSSVYFQAYRLAIDMALAAQSSYQFELDKTDTFINFNYWDSLHKGLVAGESLMLSLDQLEQAYINNNSRRLEVEKTISLAQTGDFVPENFVLNANGSIPFSLSEQLFDKDFPGHYGRKLKTISVSVMAKTDTVAEVHATLSQLNNYVLMAPDSAGVKYLNSLFAKTSQPPQDNPPASIRADWLPNQQVAISTGQDDTGMFALNFFLDDRYFPFEGTGAVSKWMLNIPNDSNLEIFHSITDVVIKLRYTALDGGDGFRGEVNSEAKGNN